MKTLSEIELPTDQQPIATCTRYAFLHVTTVCFANKIDILHEEQKNSKFEASAQN